MIQKRIILNADDFGARPQTNAAILRAHKEGVLTSASLMVAERAAEEAALIARETPTLAVGLHLALSDGCSLLHSESIPGLADHNGRFLADPVKAGFYYCTRKSLRADIRREMEAQFEKFLSLGIPCDHVNGHQHMHIMPPVWDIMVDLCQKFNIKRVRVPYEEFRPATGERPVMRRVEMAFFRAMHRRCISSVRGKGFVIADRVYGQQETGNMTLKYTLGLLERLQGRINEIYYHPGTLHARPLPGDSSGMDTDLDALLSKDVRAKIDQLKLVRTVYGAL